MDLTSCNGCGIVLDKNKLKFDNGWMQLFKHNRFT